MESILSFVGDETDNCSLSKSFLGTYCKGAVGKKGAKILVGEHQKMPKDRFSVLNCLQYKFDKI